MSNEVASTTGRDETSLLIVGPGVLGSLIGSLWLREHPGATVIGQTNTEANHDRCNPCLLHKRASMMTLKEVSNGTDPMTEIIGHQTSSKCAQLVWGVDAALTCTHVVIKLSKAKLQAIMPAANRPEVTAADCPPLQRLCVVR